ncbi:c-type cytochrome [Kaarinaea lacus]
MNKRRLCFSVISMSLCLFISSGGYAADADADAGRVISTRCAICHGMDGEGNGAPKSKISGMDVDKFIKRVNEYKSGACKNVMMERFTKNLTDEDIENLAAYYSTK